MSTITIRKAKREGARLVLSLAGLSGTGKTYTGLLLAYGLAKYDASKIGLLDTENKRGSLYANVLVDKFGVVQEFNVGDLEPPFSPKRYIDAIMQFQKAGVEVLVIDSVTHEWEGTGGCEEIAYAGNPRMPDWATAKREHKAFVNALLQSNMHIIVCVRAREKVKIEKINNKNEVIPIGIQPVQEKNFMFEMTASVMMYNEGLSQDVMKCPAELRNILGRGEGYIGSADGKALRDWVDGAEKLDSEIEHARNTLRTTCEGGLVELEKAFLAMSAKIKKALKADGTIETLKASASAFDAARVAAQAGGQDLKDLNDHVFGGGSATT